MDADTSEIKALKRIVWRTAIAGRVQRFAKLLNDPDSQKYFGEAFVGALTLKIQRIYRLQFVLTAIYIVLMLSLYAAQDPQKSEFQILGYSFKNLGYYKEFLLFAAAILTPASSIVSAYARYLGELRKETLRKLFPDPGVLEFAAHVYSDIYFDALVKDQRLSHSRPHAVTTLLLAFFGLALIALVIALIVASFLLQISVIYDVASNPSSSPAINAFIVAFSLGAIALSWLVGLLQLPLPEVDVGAFAKLSELRDREPAKYQETMRRLSVESDRRERIWSIATAVSTFVVVFVITAWFLLTPLQRNSWPVMFASLPGLALSVFLSTNVGKQLKRKIYASYFQKFPDGTDKDLKAFSRATRLIGVCRAAVLLVSTVSYSFLALGPR